MAKSNIEMEYPLNLRSIVVKEPHYEAILFGKENVHMRGQGTKFRGILGITARGSNSVSALVTLEDVIGKVEDEKLILNRPDLIISESRLIESLDNNWRTAWVFSNVKILSKPISFLPKNASAFWFILSELETKNIFQKYNYL